MVSEQKGALCTIYRSSGSQCYLEWQGYKLFNSLYFHIAIAGTGRAGVGHNTLSAAHGAAAISLTNSEG